jgi:hypothetical protein
MSNSIVIRPNGVTTAISVAGTSTSETAITANTNDQVNYAAFLNTGSTSVAVKLGATGLAAAVMPISGTSTGGFVLPPLMVQPTNLAVPAMPFYVRMIGSAAGPSIVYITPIGDQS